MPEIYANWSRNLRLNGDEGTAFSYLTTLPEQVSRQADRCEDSYKAKEFKLTSI